MARYAGPKILLPRAGPARQPLTYFRLRVALSVLCGIVTMLMIVLWMRSYWRNEIFAVIRSSTATAVASRHGRISLSVEQMSVPDSSYFNSNPILGRVSRPMFPSLLWHNKRPSYIHVAIPYWLLALLSITVAGSAWIRWSTRFSLRTMLIATTLVAVALGLVAAVTRQ